MESEMKAVELHQVSTAELVRELEKREGVKTITAKPYKKVQISVEGPAVILEVVD